MKKLGLGAMRLPMIGDTVDIEHFKSMVDLFMDRGFNYFDTARVYIEGQSETALKAALTSRYPRESYYLTDKLSPSCFEKEEDIIPFFESQLDSCGVEYFDYYLMHSQHKGNYDKFKSCRAYEIAAELKAAGKIKHVGISFHDSAEFLDKILTEQPAIEAVQLQFNYMDLESPTVQSLACYETARRHGKDVLIMEPVKGGSLANIPEEAKEVFAEIGDASPASYAIRFAAGFDGVITVLSGMSTVEQVEDNVGYMQNFTPLTDHELDAVNKVRDIINSKYLIPCTGCNYCVDGCPMNIRIPRLFSCMNSLKAYANEESRKWYAHITEKSGKASDCIGCGACESSCPQKLPIRDLLASVALKFE